MGWPCQGLGWIWAELADGWSVHVLGWPCAGHAKVRPCHGQGLPCVLLVMGCAGNGLDRARHWLSLAGHMLGWVGQGLGLSGPGAAGLSSHDLPLYRAGAGVAMVVCLLGWLFVRLGLEWSGLAMG
jgi:hypothetical protein